MAGGVEDRLTSWTNALQLRSRRIWRSMYFELAQLFNTFYHRHPILAEADEKKKKFLLATAAVVRRELIRALQ